MARDMAPLIPVDLKMRPWPTRVRNAYRNYRRLGLSMWMALELALEEAHFRSWLDIRNWRIWPK